MFIFEMDNELEESLQHRRLVLLLCACLACNAMRMLERLQTGMGHDSLYKHIDVRIVDVPLFEEPHGLLDHCLASNAQWHRLHRVQLVPSTCCNVSKDILLDLLEVWTRRLGRIREGRRLHLYGRGRRAGPRLNEGWRIARVGAIL